jgi:hypothetical protein
MWDNVRKYCGAGKATVDNMAHALHAGYLRLQTHSQIMSYLLLFHCKSGCTNASQCYVTQQLPLLFFCNVGDCFDTYQGCTTYKYKTTVAASCIWFTYRYAIWLPVAEVCLRSKAEKDILTSSSKGALIFRIALYFDTLPGSCHEICDRKFFAYRRDALGLAKDKTRLIVFY